MTLNIYQYPVYAEDDNTYERCAIEHWFSSKGKPISPLTNLVLKSSTLRENRIINSLITARIEELKKINAEPIEDTKPSAMDETKPSSIRLNVPTEDTKPLSTNDLTKSRKESIEKTKPNQVLHQ